MRTLCTIQQIEQVWPIEEKDKIQYAKMKDLLYRVIVTKDINVGDVVIYCEVDTILPKENPAFAFLEGKRIRAKKMAGVVSQGIIFPLNTLPEGNYEIGQDIEDLLGATKWEPDIYNVKTKGGVQGMADFHPLVPKTDETRFQNLGREIIKNIGVECYITEKVDGSSFTFVKCNLIDKPEFYSRNQAQNAETPFGYIYNKIIAPIKEQFPENIAIQGEILGPTIQGNKYKLKDLALKVFNVYDIANTRYYEFEELINFCKTFNLQTVPVINDNFILHNDWEKLENLSKNKSTLLSSQDAEGIVIRSKKNINNQMFSFKIINPDFLVKN